MKKNAQILCLACMAAFMFTGCLEEDGCMYDSCNEYGMMSDYVVTKSPLTAYCSIAVEGYGTVQLETDYVPNTTWCENGHSPAEGLKAQAAAARTFAYYKISTGNTPVKNSQGDQVYKCESRAPSAAQFAACQEATNATSGQIMTYKGTITAGFYVSGVTTAYLDDECKPTVSSGQTGWVSVQKNVTYNKGKTGDNITQSSIGWVNAKNYANRGCMAQNGATCLANHGYVWQDILRYFYGDDIVIEKAEGACVAESPKCETQLSQSGTIIDELDPCFNKSSSSSWFDVNQGYNNHLYSTYVWNKAAETIGTWNINVTRPGTYEVFAYIQPGVGAMSEQAPYIIRASGTETTVKMNLSGKSGWLSLGNYTFAPGGDQWVRLSDASGEPYTDKNGKRIVFDAIKFEDATSCTDACVLNTTQCAVNGVQTCVKNSSTGCSEWSEAVACSGGQTCIGGNCSDSCEDTCVADTKQCDGNHVVTCVRNASSGCTEYQITETCNAPQICSNSACIDKPANCNDECVPGELNCVDANNYKICTDVNGCYLWSESATSCPNTQICQNNACVLDSASSGDAKQCLTQVKPAGTTIIDELDGCFSLSDSNRWSELYGFGYGDHLYYSRVTDEATIAIGTWRLNVLTTGKYSIYAYIESGAGASTTNAIYTVQGVGALQSLSLDLSNQSGWIKLGDFYLAANQSQYVQLIDYTGETGADATRRVLFDALQIAPYGTPIDNTLSHQDGSHGTKPNPNAPDGDEDLDPEAESGSASSSDSDCSSHPRSNHSSAPLFMLLALGTAVGINRRRCVKKSPFSL